jgi:lipopolysaccharide/colanic/teichoic acid biosynthesis glycosyltransferase
MAGHSAPFEELAICSKDVFAPSAWDSLQRGVDVALIVLTLPFWASILIATVALKLLFDGGPVLFRHVRLGRRGQPFLLYKIRTTPPDFQPRQDDWSDEDFPPRTRFGRWLRRFDLDELPQLYNVLKGDMSLVGPRPEMPLHAEKFGWRLPEYSQRLMVRPGLSGLAQVRGWRGNTSIHQRLRCDLEYSSGRGPAMYFAILARTVRVEVLRAISGD